ISNMDTPLTPSVKGSRGLSAYLSGVTEEMMQKERSEVTATKEDIRALADIVQAVLDTGSFCVVGNEEKDRGKPRDVRKCRRETFREHKMFL
ncbi:MAG: hypothetical protein V8S27_02820, partial [Lachnospiraceae bacterium]